MIRVVALQTSCRPFEVTENLDRTGEWIEKAVSGGAKLVVLPELFGIGYTFSDRLFEFSEPLHGPTVAWMKAISAKLDVYLTGCIYEKDGKDSYDTMVFTTPRGEVFHYRKRHPAFCENIYFRSGDSPGIFPAGPIKIGVAVCWDMVYRDTLERLRGQADLVLISSAWPSLQMPKAGRLFQGVEWALRRNAQLAPIRMAEELGAPVVFANRAGRFRSEIPFSGLRVSMPFLGQSAVVSFEGRLIERLGMEEGMVIADIDTPSRYEVSPNSKFDKVPGGKYIVPIPGMVRAFQSYWESLGRVLYLSKTRKRSKNSA